MPYHKSFLNIVRYKSNPEVFLKVSLVLYHWHILFSYKINNIFLIQVRKTDGKIIHAIRPRLHERVLFESTNYDDNLPGSSIKY